MHAWYELRFLKFLKFRFRIYIYFRFEILQVSYQKQFLTASILKIS